MSALRVTLKPGRERSLLRRHPWVFSGAIDKVQGAPQSGATVEVRAADGAFLAWAAYSPASQIRARVWSFDEADVPGPELFGKKTEAALALRRAAIAPEPRPTERDASTATQSGRARQTLPCRYWTES